MTDDDRYRHHAYSYGWQRAMLGRREPFEPLDPQGLWYVSEMADRAEDFQRKRVGMPAREKPVRALTAADPTTVRTNWRQLYRRDMTKAELALSEEHRDETMRRLRAENPRAFATVERALGSDRPRHMPLKDAIAEIRAEMGIPEAKEIPPPEAPSP